MYSSKSVQEYTTNRIGGILDFSRYHYEVVLFLQKFKDRFHLFRPSSQVCGIIFCSKKQKIIEFKYLERFYMFFISTNRNLQNFPYVFSMIEQYQHKSTCRCSSTIKLMLD
jgi:hypothetical protein